jgi:hypothetical protein
MYCGVGFVGCSIPLLMNQVASLEAHIYTELPFYLVLCSFQILY